MAKRKTFLIQWSEWSELPEALGHGVEFHAEPPAQKPTLIAFLEDYEWLRGKPKAVTIFIRREGNGYTAGFLMETKQQIENALKSGNLKHGPLGKRLFAWFNA